MAPDRTSGDLPDLLRRYVRQETMDPLRSLGRFLGFGIAGSFMMGVGVILLGVGALRLLQNWSRFSNSWSWVPYLVVATALSTTAVLAGRRISIGSPRGDGVKR
jgi:hypothetical protein